MGARALRPRKDDGDVAIWEPITRGRSVAAFEGLPHPWYARTARGSEEGKDRLQDCGPVLPSAVSNCRGGHNSLASSLEYAPAQHHAELAMMAEVDHTSSESGADSSTAVRPQCWKGVRPIWREQWHAKNHTFARTANSMALIVANSSIGPARELGTNWR